MMHDRTFLARLCVDIDGVNMLVVFSRRRDAESLLAYDLVAQMLVVMLAIFF